MEEIETDCFRFRNGIGNSQKECELFEGESGKGGDESDVTSSAGGSLGRRRSVLDRGPIKRSVSALQMVEVSSNGVGEKSGSVFEKKSLKKGQRNGRLGTHRNTGECESVIIITGHYASVGNLNEGLA